MKQRTYDGLRKLLRIIATNMTVEITVKGEHGELTRYFKGEYEGLMICRWEKEVQSIIDTQHESDEEFSSPKF